MGAVTVQEITAKVQGLGRGDLEKLYYIIREILYPGGTTHEQFVVDLQDSKFVAGLVCPHCSGTNVIRFGHPEGRQRYKCKDDERCGKIFSDFTKSPISRSRYPEKWILFAECMLKGLALRATAKELGITLPTAFYWRHKLLKALQKPDLAPFEGITEADETFFLFSEKGRRGIPNRDPRRRGGVASMRGLSHEQVCVMVAYNRNNDQVLSRVACTGQITRDSLDHVIGPFVSKTTILCTDAGRGYRPYCKDKKIEHVQLKKDQRKHGIYHVQNVNSYHSGLKKWIRRFNGVASKYLDGYLAWFGFAVKKGAVALQVKTKDMMIEACMKGSEETWESIRSSKFKAAA